METELEANLKEAAATLSLHNEEEVKFAYIKREEFSNLDTYVFLGSNPELRNIYEIPAACINMSRYWKKHTILDFKLEV